MGKKVEKFSPDKVASQVSRRSQEDDGCERESNGAMTQKEEEGLALAARELFSRA